MANWGRKAGLLLAGVLAYRWLLRQTPVPLPAPETKPLPREAPPPIPRAPEALGLTALTASVYTPSGTLREQARLEVVAGTLQHPTLEESLRLRDGDAVVLVLEIANPTDRNETGFVQARLVDESGAIRAYFWREGANQWPVTVPAHTLLRVSLGASISRADFAEERQPLDLVVFVDTPSVEHTESYSAVRLFAWEP